MRISHISRIAAAALLLAVWAVAASAQVTRIEGKVTLQQADGTEAPVKDAVIDIYRIDIAGKYNAKTDKNGRYVHAGIPLTGTYTLAVSAPGAAPTFRANMRLSQQPENDFKLTPGDGRKLTLDEIKTATAAGGGSVPGSDTGGKVSAEDKAKAEELKKKVAEIEAGNKKIEEGNAVVKRTFEAGNEAYKAKRYDEAIALFDEGLAARPDEAGLLISKSFTLIGRGVTRYNTFIQSKDDAVKENAFKDWRGAADAASKALEITKTATATDPATQANQAQNKLAAITARAEAMKFVATKVDKSQADAAFQAYQELITAETDPAKKTKAQFEAANVLFDANVYDRAATEFQKIVAADPDNANAYLKLGFALFNTGDKAKFQEAANYMQRFVDKAPETDPQKAEVRSILEFLKTQENIKPEKIEPTRPARRRG
ncbi:MAG: carboxypeptidase regulatory-like domain-containing protein [Pyrinomonadaceae bacterium]